MKFNLKRKTTSNNLEKQALSWTEYLMAHMLKARFNPEKEIVVYVPNKFVQHMIDDAIADLCQQSNEAWQLRTEVITVH